MTGNQGHVSSQSGPGMSEGSTDDLPGYCIHLLYAAHINLVVDVQTFDVSSVALQLHDEGLQMQHCESAMHSASWKATVLLANPSPNKP